MPVKKSIFGSKGEERGFFSIERTFGESYRLFSQVKFAELFTQSSKPQPSEGLYHYLATSLDYVLCTREGIPVVAIDFDGMGEGFDRDGEYVQCEPTKDRDRKAKFDRKLHWAKTNGLPYHIISSRELNSLDDIDGLTVADGIIGVAMAVDSFRKRAVRVLEEHADAIDNVLFGEDRQEHINSLLNKVEVESYLEHNPICRQALEFRKQIVAMVGGEWFAKTYMMRYSFSTRAELPELCWPPWDDRRGVQRRVEALGRVKANLCQCTMLDTPVGEVSAEVNIRNTSYSAILSKDIAEFLALKKLLVHLRRFGGYVNGTHPP